MDDAGELVRRLDGVPVLVRHHHVGEELAVLVGQPGEEGAVVADRVRVGCVRRQAVEGVVLDVLGRGAAADAVRELGGVGLRGVDAEESALEGGEVLPEDAGELPAPVPLQIREGVARRDIDGVGRCSGDVQVGGRDVGVARGRRGPGRGRCRAAGQRQRRNQDGQEHERGSSGALHAAGSSHRQERGGRITTAPSTRAGRCRTRRSPRQGNPGEGCANERVRGSAAPSAQMS